MFAVSMRANYLYGHSIGQTPDTQLAIAWANVGADLWKGFGLIVVVALWRSRWRRGAITVCLTWLVCLSFSVSSAIGIYVQERTALTSGREAKHASYEDVKKELGEVEEKQKMLGHHRPASQVEAAIVGVLARPVMIGERVRGTVGALSLNCGKSDARTAGDCVEVARLRGELAASVELARLEARGATLRQQLNTLRERGSAAAPDPVGEFWAWVTRGLVSVRDVGFGLPLFFALMIEMVSAFGPVGITAYAEVTRRPAARNDVAGSGALRRAMAGSVTAQHGTISSEREVGRVVEYMAERTEPTTNPSGLGAEDLYADYGVWCVSNSLRALAEHEFLEEFDRVRSSPELAGKVQKFGARYFGIALVHSRVAAASNGRPESDR
jgi:hypothetical protein